MERNRRKLSNFSTKLEAQVEVRLETNNCLDRERLQQMQDEYMDQQIRLEFANKTDSAAQHQKTVFAARKFPIS